MPTPHDRLDELERKLEALLAALEEEAER